MKNTYVRTRIELHLEWRKQFLVGLSPTATPVMDQSSGCQKVRRGIRYPTKKVGTKHRNQKTKLGENKNGPWIVMRLD